MTASSTAAATLPGFQVRLGTPGTRFAAAGMVVAGIVLASLPSWGSAADMKLLVDVFTLLALAQMWNLLAGYAGLVSIGQQAFVGIGAYGLYAFGDIAGLPVLAAIALTAVVAGIVALVASVFVFRLHGGYFAVGTWVIAEVIRLLVMQSPNLGAGTGVTVHSMTGMAVADRQAMTYWLALAVGFGSILLVAVILRSRVGLALGAVRDSEVAARSLGVDVGRVKLFIYVVASVGAAVAGSVIYIQLLRIQPTAAFSVDWTARMIFVVVIGGLGRIEGPIIGTVVFFLLQENLSDYGVLYLILLGVVAIAVVLLAPRGLWGLWVDRFPMALVAVQRRLVRTGADGAAGDAPGAPPTASEPSAP